MWRSPGLRRFRAAPAVASTSMASSASAGRPGPRRGPAGPRRGRRRTGSAARSSSQRAAHPPVTVHAPGGSPSSPGSGSGRRPSRRAGRFEMSDGLASNGRGDSRRARGAPGRRPIRDLVDELLGDPEGLGVAVALVGARRGRHPLAQLGGVVTPDRRRQLVHHVRGQRRTGGTAHATGPGRAACSGRAAFAGRAARTGPTSASRGVLHHFFEDPDLVAPARTGTGGTPASGLSFASGRFRRRLVEDARSLTGDAPPPAQSRGDGCRRRPRRRPGGRTFVFRAASGRGSGASRSRGRSVARRWAGVTRAARRWAGRQWVGRSSVGRSVCPLTEPMWVGRHHGPAWSGGRHRVPWSGVSVGAYRWRAWWVGAHRSVLVPGASFRARRVVPGERLGAWGGRGQLSPTSAVAEHSGTRWPGYAGAEPQGDPDAERSMGGRSTTGPPSAGERGAHRRAPGVGRAGQVEPRIPFPRDDDPGCGAPIAIRPIVRCRAERGCQIWTANPAR